MASCHKEDANLLQIDPDGVVFSLPYQWKKSLHNDKSFNSNGRIKQTIYYKGNIAIPTTNGENNRFLTLINSDNGETIWNWNDSYLPYSNQIDISYYYQNNNLLTYQTGSRCYGINLDTGITQWKFQGNLSFHSKVTGIGNNYFTFAESTSKYQEYQEYVAYKGNLQTGNVEEYIIPNFTLEHILGNRIGDVTRVEPYMFNGVQHLAVTWQELTDDTVWKFQTYLGLYNYTTDEWVYEKKVMNEPFIYGVVLAPPVIYQDKFYANVGKHLVCHDLATGDQLWSKQFTQDFSFSGFIIEDDKIIANNEDTFTYGIHPENGAILWKTESAGTSGRISYLNGIAYFGGGSTGKLHAIDTETGQHVWKLGASSLGEPAGNSFKTNAVYVFPAKNGNPAKVIALSHLYAYSFEAYQ
jgi:outer membrane protein assembly factor BamB